MPIPETRDVGSTIKFLKGERPGMPQKQKTAIALNVARKAGANIPKKPGNPQPIAAEIRRRARTPRPVKPRPIGGLVGPPSPAPSPAITPTTLEERKRLAEKFRV